MTEKLYGKKSRHKYTLEAIEELCTYEETPKGWSNEIVSDLVIHIRKLEKALENIEENTMDRFIKQIARRALSEL